MKTAPSSLSASWLAHRPAQVNPHKATVAARGTQAGGMASPVELREPHTHTPENTFIPWCPGDLLTLHTRACAHSPGRQPCGHCEPGASLGLAWPWLLIRTQHHAPGPGMALTQLVQMELCTDTSDRWRGALRAQAVLVPGPWACLDPWPFPN